MSEELRAEYQRQIADPATPDAVRAWLQAQLDALPPAPAAPNTPTNTASPAAARGTVGDANTITDATAAIGNVTGGDFTQHNHVGDMMSGNAAYGQVNSSGGTTYGPQVGINQGTIIYGCRFDDREQQQLIRYLDQVERVYGRLSLRGLAVPNGMQDVRLQQVYITLATEHQVLVAAGDNQIADQYLDRNARQDSRLKHAYDPNYALPDQAILAVQTPEHAAIQTSRPGFFGRLRTILSEPSGLNSIQPWTFYRAELASEALHQQRTLVLLGDPGGGKSVFVRHMAAHLAHSALHTAGSHSIVMPIVLSLRLVARQLAVTPDPATAIFQACQQQVRALAHETPSDASMHEALKRGRVWLLADGLDEVPHDGTPERAARPTVIAALVEWSRRYSDSTLLVTCRVRAFDTAARDQFGWTVRTLAPFSLGQIRHFLHNWYREFVPALLTDDRAAALREIILKAIASHANLRDMATSPLLLTLIAQIVYNKGSLPKDRPALYERMLDLLLGQWDEVRDGEDLATVIGVPGWDSKRIRLLLERLSYTAHRDSTSQDGRGRLQRAAVRDQMIEYFRDQGLSVAQAWQAAGRCLFYIEQRSGLLVPDDNHDYVFAHLTFQEHCAGRYMLTHERAAELVLTHRHEDRWREPIMLGIGVIQGYNAALVQVILRTLIDRDEDQDELLCPKLPAQWYADLLFAHEIGEDRNWQDLRLQGVKVAQLQRDLAQGLGLLVANPWAMAQSLRLRAGTALGTLGDPRPGVCDLDVQWCAVPAGEYTLGSENRDPDGHDDEKPLHTEALPGFRIARYPVTNAQWGRFLAAGGYTDRQWWSEQGWEARESEGWTEPRYWDDAQFNAPNQPVVGVAWYEVQAFCAWLGKTLGDAVQLPTEAQWEAAARGPTRSIYPWGDAWDGERANTGESELNRTMAVGSYPHGASWCGAMDMAGNVFEWTRSAFDNPDRANEVDRMHSSALISMRGGAWNYHRQFARCACRLRVNPHYRNDTLGVRLVASFTKLKNAARITTDVGTNIQQDVSALVGGQGRTVDD